MLPEPIVSFLHSLFLLLRENDEKALFLLLLIEEAGVPLPVPGDIAIMFAGYRASIGKIGLFEAALAATVAVQLGSTILYVVSRKLGHSLLLRYGRYIHLDRSRLEQVEGWIQERGSKMVLIGRLTPGLRTPTSIMAGVFEIPFRHFIAYTTLAALAWSVFWLSMGFFFGNNLMPVVRQLHPSFVEGAVALLVIGVALAALWRVGGNESRLRKWLSSLLGSVSKPPARR